MAEAILAVRGGLGAKSRLAAVFSDAERAALVEAMLLDMLDALAGAGAGAVRRVWVVTPTERLERLAAAAGARVIREPRPAGLNAAFRCGLAAAAEEAPYADIVLLPGDLPTLRAQDVDAALLLLRTHDLVLALASRDGGTGLLAVRAGVPFTPQFGAQSCARHRRQARARGLSCALVEAGSLALDLDRPEDAVEVARGPCGRRTAEVLSDLKSRWRAQ
ncbi:conserved hypothetical protein [Phenylobacterium zucineum HLK1]|uniref:3-phospho-D-glycerate guanylyltransferase n=1 Tax=Phenylobacterium zucineum (strain HLK1) TaxID=450851 RepID=FBID_PHEZH|nr:2-phospho-L-lactate guanylyltransferase [Phenylobacterium zucineum]B4RGP0.1 RecName: Full=3-phospho-D-glycerate guanylyltransferase; Short=3PG guanylyltransferase [Phenylobacterium zucineum HLK1]ACG78946.1 conserved hypothetical protein [Phenylobacterium zucineum HLK1]